MTLAQALNLAPLVLFVGFQALEAAFPAHRLPRSIGWRVGGFAWFLVSGGIFSNAPRLWHGWAAEHHLLNGAVLGLWGAPVALLVVNFVGYAWHRLRHTVPALWRLHQLHHSAERLDVSGAFMFHPLETLVMAFLVSMTSTFVLGLTADASALAGAIAFFCACFQHANVRTPRFVGYVIQRPESHSVHHGRGVHASNYADLPLVDLLFGTFVNPVERTTSLGFSDGASRRIGSMLLAADVSRSESPSPALPVEN